MHFPDWCEVADPAAKASNRLRYLLRQAAATVTENGSFAAFALHCEIDRTTMHQYIARGSFSPQMALTIERCVGPAVLRATHLTNPLTIGEK